MCHIMNVFKYAGYIVGQWKISGQLCNNAYARPNLRTGRHAVAVTCLFNIVETIL
jgi:hypothetical protein